MFLTLMVTSDGLPVDYEIFAGDIYEGRTLIPALTKIRKKYHIDKIVFVADSAMLSQENIEELEGESFKYIIGAKLKKVKNKPKDKILDPNNYKEITPGYQIAHFSETIGR
ncbi:MAG: transposase [Candidatus Atribacteria bacterium]|nr:transposase [Candidatus Atribacteria bacterium]